MDMKKGSLTLVEAVGLIVSLVIGVGIFKTPSLVAGNVSNAYGLIFLWIAGGMASLLGALCYAELATAYPHPGGEYHYIGRAFGKKLAFLFGWSRMMVIQTGSIAMLAFIFGDYTAQIIPLGSRSLSLYAASSIVILTLINIAGARKGKWTQNLLTAVKVLGLSAIVFAGMFSSYQPVSTGHDVPTTSGALGLAMVFIMLTYGGWNEAAYISSEVRNAKHNMVRSLVWGVSLITAIYVLINLVFVRALGVSAMGQSEAIAWDMIHRIAGTRGAMLMSVFVGISALGSMNASMITGARTNFALAKEFTLFRHMGSWHETTGSPANALAVQGTISLLLVLLGALTRNGFVTMVGYTAPVFWFFFLLATLSLIVLRRREPDVLRSFKVPFYPLTPILFSVICLCMLISSLQYAGVGALAGVAVLVTGVPFFIISLRNTPLNER
jgi:APA family basic amino acid/polyamine antiporter